MLPSNTCVLHSHPWSLQVQSFLSDESYKETLRKFCWGGVFSFHALKSRLLSLTTSLSQSALCPGGVEICSVVAAWAGALCAERAAIRPAVLDLAAQKVQCCAPQRIVIVVYIFSAASNRRH